MTRTTRGRILLDIAPLRQSVDFRLLFGGQMITMLGNQLTAVAIPFEIYRLTGSSLQVGAVSLAQLVPLILGALVGGSLGDTSDRRTILRVTPVLLAFTSAGLALDTARAHPSVILIYLLCAAASGLGGALSAAAASAVPFLVEPDQLLGAYAAMQVVDQIGMVFGPAVAGVLIGLVHLPWVFGADAVSFVVMAAAAWRLSPLPAAAPERPRFAAMLDGLRSIKGRQIVQGAFLIDLNATIFGLPRALFPALAISVFHGGPATLGLLSAAPGAGALVGAASAGWLDQVRRQTRLVIGAVCIWGAAIAAFGFAHVLWAALGLLAVAGWADVVSAVIRTTILQRAVPEALRGRISALQIAVVEGGPRLGDLQSGAVASAVSTQFSVVSGGLVCIVGALAIGAFLPEFRNSGSAAL